MPGWSEESGADGGDHGARRTAAQESVVDALCRSTGLGGRDVWPVAKMVLPQLRATDAIRVPGSSTTPAIPKKGVHSVGCPPSIAGSLAMNGELSGGGGDNVALQSPCEPAGGVRSVSD